MIVLNPANTLKGQITDDFKRYKDKNTGNMMHT